MVTVLLIAANFVAFLYELSLSPGGYERLVLSGGAIPYEIANWVDIRPRDLLPLPGSIFTSMFLHGGWMHLIGNMWFLWIFGDNVEERLGTIRYIIFYFVVGVAGALAQVFSLPSSTAPMIGASGAIAGVLGGYVMLYPRAKVVTFVAIPLLWHVRDVAAWIFLGIWIAQQALFGYLGLTQPAGGGGGVAYFAHIGGFAFGLAAIRLFASKARTQRQLQRAGMA